MSKLSTTKIHTSEIYRRSCLAIAPRPRRILEALNLIVRLQAQRSYILPIRRKPIDSISSGIQVDHREDTFVHIYSPENSAHLSTNHTLSLTVRAHFEEPLWQILIRGTQVFICRGTDGIARQPHTFFSVSLVDPSVPSCECSHG